MFFDCGLKVGVDSFGEGYDLFWFLYGIGDYVG
jgi:hypothetical protein